VKVGEMNVQYKLETFIFEGHKSVKRRKSAQSQASVNSSQGTGGSSTTLSMNCKSAIICVIATIPPHNLAQQPASNGTPTTPMTPITSFSSIYERMNMDEETEKSPPITGAKIGRAPSKKMAKSEQQKTLPKQKRNSGEGGGGGNGSPNDNLNKEVTSGGRVPKKTRRIRLAKERDSLTHLLIGKSHILAWKLTG
jgi:hypothetical protein